MRSSTLLLGCLLAEAASVPDTMTAAYKAGINPFCQTPFNCVKTHTIKTPTPGKGEVLIEVASSSVNPCDVDYLEFGVGCSGGGGVLGMDVGGTVAAVGEGCTRLKVGDRVWSDTGALKGDSGGMATYAVTTEMQTGLAPSNLNLTEAGVVPLVGLTALEMWDKVATAFGGANKLANKTMVVTAGTGGTGHMGLQMGKKVFEAGTMVTSTSGAEDIALAKHWGADVVVDYKVRVRETPLPLLPRPAHDCRCSRPTSRAPLKVQNDVFEKLADNSVDIVFDNYGKLQSRRCRQLSGLFWITISLY